MVEKETEGKVKKEDKTSKILVVAQLPTQTVNKAKDDDGNEFNLMTIEDALTLLLEKVTKIEKATA